MNPPHTGRADFSHRRDNSLGWAALESRQAAALASALASAPGLPLELLPFPPRPRRRRSAGDILALCVFTLLALQLCYLLGTSILIIVYRRIDPPATVLMAYRKWFFGWKLEAPRPVTLRKVPRYIRQMLVSVEDGKFYEHHGLDFEAFQRAREMNRRLGKPLYGGSTLTMQVARTLFLVPEKSYLRKYLEALTALELEAFLPKERILELYFGYAEWGRGIFGIEAASRKWFGRGSAGLSRDQAARLLALLSSPIRYGPATLQKNGILRERFRYLSARYDRPLPEAEALFIAAQQAVMAEAPPPSAEPEPAESEPAATEPQAAELSSEGQSPAQP